MKNGSLLEVVEDCKGVYVVNGVPTKLLKHLLVGDIVTCGGVGKCNRGLDCVIILEDDGKIHPILMTPLMRHIRKFREIQPPMEITIEEILTEKV